MSATLLPRRSAGVLRQIEGACEADLEPAALLPLVVEQLGRVVPLDAYFLQASDPETMLGLGAGVTHGMPHELCAPFWAFEFEVPDFNKFADLAREEAS